MKKIIIIAGAAHSGKTTFVNNIYKSFNDFIYIPETAREVIFEWKEKKKILPWDNRSDINLLREFQENIAQKQMKYFIDMHKILLNPENKNKYFIMDRSMEDIESFWEIYSNNNNYPLSYFIPTINFFSKYCNLTQNDFRIILMKPKPFFIIKDYDRFEDNNDLLNYEFYHIERMYNKYYKDIIILE